MQKELLHSHQRYELVLADDEAKHKVLRKGNLLGIVSSDQRHYNLKPRISDELV